MLKGARNFQTHFLFILLIFFTLNTILGQTKSILSYMHHAKKLSVEK